MVAVGCCAVVFGTAHYTGNPSGLLGMAMATTYGVALGVIRHRSGGLLMPWIAHLCADAVIAVVLLTIDL